MKSIATVVALALGVLVVGSPALADSKASRGMGVGHGPCWPLATAAERALMKHESSGWPTARNPRSTAFGCGQLLIVNRRRFARACDTVASTVDPSSSMCLMRAYVRSRYGSTGRALAFRRARGWY